MRCKALAAFALACAPLSFAPHAAQAEELSAAARETQRLEALAVALMEAEALAQRGLERAELGMLSLPTGRLVAVDPFTAWGMKAQSIALPAGDYRLDRVFPARDPTRTALAILRTASCRPLLWQPAVPEGAALADLASGGVFGFGVDAGTGSMADMAFWESFGTGPGGAFPGPEFEAYSDNVLFARMFPDQTDIPRDFIASHGPASVAVYSAGYGDGFYANFWGFSPEGCPCAFVTDFAIMERGAAWDYETQTALGPPPDISGLRYSLDPAETGSFASCKGQS